MKPIVLFRSDIHTLDELALAKASFDCVPLRSQVPPNSLVIGRYSVLPFYKELQDDLATHGSRLINSFAQHQYIAEASWIYDCPQTFATWFDFPSIPQHLRDQPFVVKGRTNSRKFQWNTKMFAKNFQDAVLIGSELANDPLIGPQGLMIRQYQPLETLEIGINQMPMVNEWRIFFYKTTPLHHTFYWSTLDDTSQVDQRRDDFEKHGMAFAQDCAKTISEFCDFFVLDCAKDIHGKWWLVEVNDGQMSGLNQSDPAPLYQNLAKILELSLKPQSSSKPKL